LVENALRKEASGLTKNNGDVVVGPLRFFSNSDTRIRVPGCDRDTIAVDVVSLISNKKWRTKMDSKKEVEELVQLISSAKPESKGVIAKADLAASGRQRAKAVLFIPDHASIEDDLQIEVVGINPALMGAMVARRC
jgi:hypothetical protein